MFARIVTFTGATDIDAGVRYLRDTVAPLLREQKGFRGVAASADRAGGVVDVLSLWDTEAERDASDTALGKTRTEGQRIIGGQMTVELFEELGAETGAEPPTAGCSLLVRRISMDPAQIEENSEFFRREVLPLIKAGAGFRAVRQMINRQTGEGVVGTIWADRASMEAAAEAAEARRPVAAQRRVTFGEQFSREIVFTELG
jgi:heme-degrading monooxygenase HmoA